MKVSKIFLLFIFIASASGCKKFLDVNKDPNNPVTVPEKGILPAIEVVVGTSIAGGNGGIATITAYWTQQMALNQEQPQIDGYKINPDGSDWNLFYPPLLNLKVMNDKAENGKNYAYAAISKILSAYIMGTVTDLYGDVPYSQALLGVENLKPVYDKQEDIYKGLQTTLDNAIADIAKAPGTAPGDDDFIYHGDMAKWKKFAYTLKARYYIHLTKAPAYTAVAQADLALAALQNGFTSNNDDAKISYPGTAGFESPWFKNTESGAGGVVLASTFVDSLVTRADPRLPVMAAEAATGGGYHGRIIGSPANPDPDEYSRINDFYAGVAANAYILNYTETLFIKAEATFIKSGASAAIPFYKLAITNHMDKLGINTASAPAQLYLTTRSNLTTGNALQKIMEEKAISNFLSIENYNDWRRTGFPKLLPVQNSYYPAIPRRIPYPLTSITANPQPQQLATVTTNVWWNQ
jgi:hypothetical protein